MLLIGYILLYIITLGLILLVIYSLPQDYFITASSTQTPQNSFINSKIVKIARNILGFILIVAGAIMLIFPGPGILTLITGLILFDFPGKKALLQKLVSFPSVQKSLNYLRQKMGKPPFIFEKRE